LVTEADVAAEKAILDVLKREQPDIGVVSEESNSQYDGIPAGRVWIVDPLDGTTNFAHHFPWFAVSIAMAVDGDPQVGIIYAPAWEELFCTCLGGGAWLNGFGIDVSAAATLGDALLATGFPYAIRNKSKEVVKVLESFLVRGQGIRRAGAASLDLAYVACGRLDGFWEIDLKPWDTAAGMLLVTEAGGRLSNFAGRAYSCFDDEVLASNGRIHEDMLEVFRTLK